MTNYDLLNPRSAFPVPAQLLLNWYDKNHRILPWRVTPDDRRSGVINDPYRVWLSEIMLQQTVVEAVKPYFLKFTTLWPDIAALAQASEDEVLRGWAGLGYYSRARNLKKCADIVATQLNGRFPETVAALKQLPGIGDYTAAAIAAIAFNRPATVVDGNVERVISRLYAIDQPLPAAKKPIRQYMQSLTPGCRPGDFAQAMMDLGSMICTPKRPNCPLCPLQENCTAFKQNNAELYPIKAAKKVRPVRYGAAFVAISEHNSILLRKRPDKGLLASMAEVPGSDWVTEPDDAPIPAVAHATTTDHAPFDADWKLCGTVNHIFTHFELRLSVYSAKNIHINVTNNGWWVPVPELPHEALPTVMKKAISAAIPHAFRSA